MAVLHTLDGLGSDRLEHRSNRSFVRVVNGEYRRAYRVGDLDGIDSYILYACQIEVNPYTRPRSLQIFK